MKASCIRTVGMVTIRSLLILIAAGLTGAVAMFFLLIAAGLLLIPFAGASGPAIAAIAGVVAVPFWLAGAFLVGGPTWAALHLAGRRDDRSALAAGAIAAGVGVPFALWAMATGLTIRPFEPVAAAGLAALAVLGAVSGGVAGRTLWRAAYGKQTR